MIKTIPEASSSAITILRKLALTRQLNSFVLPHWYQAVGSMMRFGMGLLKNEYGVFHVRRKVPRRLEAATARVLDLPKERVSWLKQTLATKDEKQAKVLAKPVMMKFDRILAQAEALLVEHPVRTGLTKAEIKQIADFFYGHQLGADEEVREEGIGSDPVFASVHSQLTAEGIRAFWNPSDSVLHCLSQRGRHQ